MTRTTRCSVTRAPRRGLLACATTLDAGALEQLAVLLLRHPLAALLDDRTHDVNLSIPRGRLGGPGPCLVRAGACPPDNSRRMLPPPTQADQPSSASTRLWTSYVEDLALPGSIGLSAYAPRAWLASDAPQLSLNGEWRFRWSPRPPGSTTAAADPDFDDGDWDTIAVPAHWVLPPATARTASRSTPTCSIRSRSTRRTCRTRTPPVTIAARSTCRTGTCERMLLRFDGVESIYRVWLNGTEVGVGKGSRLVQEFDVTDLRPTRPQRDHGPGAPVVVDELPRRSRSVVAAGHLP